MKTEKTRVTKAGNHLGMSIIEMVHLMYQNVTAMRFLESLIGTLQAELDKRKEMERRGKASLE